MIGPFTDLPHGHFRAILADPPWRFRTWNKATAVQSRSNTPEKHGTYLSASVHYNSMAIEDLATLPVEQLAADDCCLFLWCCWPTLTDAMDLIKSWGFTYKTCAFSWMKGDPFQLWADDKTPRMGMGYWTRANTEPCLLATRGKPKRLHADVRQGIIAKPRQHSRKPDCVHERIERLVAGPYLELFARATRPGWTSWGNEVGKFDQPDTYDANKDFAGSLDAAYEAIRERKAAGGLGWSPK